MVFVPVRDDALISARVFGVLRESWEHVCAELGCTLIEADFEPDHVHLVVEYPPTQALSWVVGSLKGVSARRLGQAVPELRSRRRGRHFWSPSYCAVSSDGASAASVRAFVARQKAKARADRASSRRGVEQ